MLADLNRRGPTFDVIHIHCLYRFHGVAAAAVARSKGIPYILQAHGSLDPWHRNDKKRVKDLYHALIEDHIIRGAAGLVCTSRREERFIRALGYGGPIWVIPIGIDTNELRLAGAPDFAAAAGIAVDARVVAFLGRISAKKGVPMLVESFRHTAAAFPRAHLVIAGPDDEGIADRLMRTINGAELADRVSFPGVLGGAEKRALLQRSDVFVLPSADESFGIAVAEAMAVGCPVVISPDVAVEDVVRASGAGLVVERDPAAIARAIERVLSEPAKATAMGAAGRRAVDERFSWHMVAAKTEAMYEAVVTTGRKRAGRGTAVGAPTPKSPATRQPAFRCPRCREALKTHASNTRWACGTCGWTSSAENGIPNLLPEPTSSDHDELNHHHARGLKSTQAAHFDRLAEEEFEISRPHGTARIYRFLLTEKFRRAVAPIGPHLVDATVLCVCGGSGMDADFMARAGAIVTTSDLSLGAATRAHARSERYGLGILSIVADVEHLPYDDQSFDIVAVHDGLHHLEDPYGGLSEMARVARRWVVVTEPAQASITRLATRIGLARDTEDAGNVVARMAPREVAAFLRSQGYLVLMADRYGMYYTHRPGAVFTILSWPFVFPIVRLSWQVANALLGRFGNKMVVVAERGATTTTTAQTPPTSEIRSETQDT
jgi:glycosyltransferase involved in cell wall biosynthesis/SAM-dependent methyltransferase/ribosomal protein S27AE